MEKLQVSKARAEQDSLNIVQHGKIYEGVDQHRLSANKGKLALIRELVLWKDFLLEEEEIDERVKRESEE